MSRQLPARPSLDHLKGQAKHLLDDLRQRRPDAQLADALHEIAQEYGFPSWPKLKAHVESTIVSKWPLAGSWIVDVGRSVRHPANPFRSARMHFAIEGDSITARDIVATSEGRIEENTNTFLADGESHPTHNGYVLTATWRGDRVLETEATKDGEIVGRGRYEVSDDGSTLTISSEEQRIVCIRGNG